MKTKKKAAPAKKGEKFIPPWLNKSKDGEKGKSGKSKFVPFAKKSTKKK